VRWGIAEQNMAMMSVGMALTDLPHGIQPVSFFGSYGTFAGTMISNAVRMGLIANHVLEKNPLGEGLHQLRPGFWCVLCAHDGPETGEDGPTHHGLFWPALYGALPGMDVYRPFDANETIAMLFHALKVGRPIALSLSRPDVPVFARGEGGLPPASEATNGAYVIKPFDDPTHKDNRAVIVVAGGQTLANTLPIVPDLTRDQGLDVKVVGVTSPTLFRRLRAADPAKAASVLSDEERDGARVFSVNNGWRYFNVPVILTDRQDEAMIGVDTYLPSGKPSDLYRIAGLDPDGIKRTIVQQLEKGAGK
jgi:transketolase